MDTVKFGVTRIDIGDQPKQAFIDSLGREGVPVVNYPPDELRGEMRG